MVTNEQLMNITFTLVDEMKALKLKVSEMDSELRKLKMQKIVENMDKVSAAPTYTAKTNTESTDEEKSYPSVEDAPEWKIAFKVNTSEGISTQKVIQKAWTEKQAVFLGRTEQLFNMMNELVKAKQIQPKWSIAESSAEKIIQ
jgi:hypothetical protein